jgi:ribosomal protein L11
MAAEEFDIQKKYERKKEEERRKEKGIIEDKKRIVHVIKLYACPGAAKPGPPIGPILGQHQLNTNDFCKEFNKLTEKMDSSLVLPVLLFKKADRTFDILLRAPTLSYYISSLRASAKKTSKGILITAAFQNIIAKKYFYFRQDKKNIFISDFKYVKSALGSLRSAKLKLYY